MHECEFCEKTFNHSPVYDDGDLRYLKNKSLWRTWCSEDCMDKSSEKFWIATGYENIYG